MCRYSVHITDCLRLFECVLSSKSFFFRLQRYVYEPVCMYLIEYLFDVICLQVFSFFLSFFFFFFGAWICVCVSV